MEHVTVLSIAQLCMIQVSLKLQFAITGRTMTWRHIMLTKGTEICGQKFGGKSCAKIMLAEIFHKHSNHPPLKLYVILDDQSNRSLRHMI